MKQYVAILLSFWIVFISLFPKADTCYLFDFGTLAEHFEEHQAHENLDFWQFLWLHYAQTEHRNQDQNHKHLPFQHHHAECVSLIMLSHLSFEIKNPIQPIAQVKNYLDWQSFYHFQIADENFQPPRV